MIEQNKMNVYHSAQDAPELLPPNSIVNADCFDVFDKVADASIDMILCDLPYGTTACKWDTVLPFDKLWAQYKRVLKPSGVVVLTASQPFTSVAVMSNLKWFKYEWIWSKNMVSGFGYAKYRPMLSHENILVFCKGKTLYNPQREQTISEQVRKNNAKGVTRKQTKSNVEHMANFKKDGRELPFNTLVYPKTVQNIKCVGRAGGSLHPTQKPIALFKYLIETYTNAGMRVLDNCAGSGTTGAACIELGREYILIEKESTYFNDTIIPRLQNTIATQNSKLFNE
jgi:site-specific DNA-methyltransferase (adenine-specific)